VSCGLYKVIFLNGNSPTGRRRWRAIRAGGRFAVADFEGANFASKRVVSRVLWLEHVMKQLLDGLITLYSSFLSAMMDYDNRYQSQHKKSTEESRRAIPSCNQKKMELTSLPKNKTGLVVTTIATEKDNKARSTSLVMTLRCIELILPNDLKIRLPKCTLRYCMDATTGTNYVYGGREVRNYDQWLQMSSTRERH
jgi:hypothetical protein